MRQASRPVEKAVVLLAVLAAAAGSRAQAPPLPPQQLPQVRPAAPGAGPDTGAFRAHQQCLAEHRDAVALHNASREVADLRDNRARYERLLQSDPDARKRAPGGIDEALAKLFARYRSLGGTAPSLADVTVTPMPCPAPQALRRDSPDASSAISARRQMTVEPGALAPRPPAEPPRLFTPATAPPLRKALEASLLAHLVALRSGNAGELEKSMSSYYHGSTRNRIARGGPMTPERMAVLGGLYPDLNRTRYETAIERGPTAALVHARDAEGTDGSGKPRVEYHFFRFADEGRGWKVDGYAILNAPKFGPDGKPEPFKLPDGPRTPDEYRIDGRLRAAPPAISGP